MIRKTLPLLVGVGYFCAQGCSGSDAVPPSSSSAGGAVGGGLSTGGSTSAAQTTLSSGGVGVGGTSTTVAAGGNPAGGLSPTGGTSATKASTGGAHPVGGTSPTGGAASNTGGKANGGTSTATTGGNKASGGASGTDSTGGAQTTGGSLASGGTKSNAGSAAMGGVSTTGGAAGGNKTTGGVNATGGINATGGSTGSISTAAVTTTCPGAVPTGVTSSWCSCDQWGQWTNGNYIFYNDIWGSGAGAQCIWATTANQWGVAANHPNSSGIKSYPDISLSPAKAISAINTYTSSFSVVVPSGGAYETAYDIWVKGTSSARIEIMLWMNYTGAVGPIASSYNASGNPVADKSNVNVGGHTWNVYFGTNGSNDVVSLVRTSNTSSGNVDIKAILQWIIANDTTKYAVFTSSWTLDQVQFGFEITSDGTTQVFLVNSFSVTSS